MIGDLGLPMVREQANDLERMQMDLLEAVTPELFAGLHRLFPQGIPFTHLHITLVMHQPSGTPWVLCGPLHGPTVAYIPLGSAATELLLAEMPVKPVEWLATQSWHKMMSCYLRLVRGAWVSYDPATGLEADDIMREH